MSKKLAYFDVQGYQLYPKSFRCTIVDHEAPLQQMTGKAPFSVMEVGLIHYGSHGWHCQDAGHAPITSSMAPIVGFSSSFTWEEPGIEHHQSRIQIYWNSRLMQVVSWQSSNWQLLWAPIPASEKPLFSRVVRIVMLYSKKSRSRLVAQSIYIF